MHVIISKYLQSAIIVLISKKRLQNIIKGYLAHSGACKDS